MEEYIIVQDGDIFEVAKKLKVHYSVIAKFYSFAIAEAYVKSLK